MPNKYRQYRKSYAPIPKVGPYVPGVPEKPIDQQKIDTAIANRELALARRLTHRGADEAISYYSFSTWADIQNNPIVMMVAPKSGEVIKIDRLAVVYTPPSWGRFGDIGWRIEVDGRQLPYWRQYEPAGTIVYWRYRPLGDIDQPADITPVWIQAGQEFSVVMVGPFGPTDVPCELSVEVRLTGRIFRGGGYMSEGE